MMATMKTSAFVSVLLLASALDVAPRCGGCGRSDHTAREFAREVERPQPVEEASQPVAAEPVADPAGEPEKAAPLQVASDEEPAADAAAKTAE